MNENLLAITKAFDLTASQIAGLMHNGFAASFLDPDRVGAYQAEVEQVLSEFGNH